MLASLLVSWLTQWFLLQYGRLRSEFDSQCDLEGGASGVLALSRLLLIFYQRDSDHHRLVSTPPSSPHLSHSHPPLLSPSLSPHLLPSLFLSSPFFLSLSFFPPPSSSLSLPSPFFLSLSLSHTHLSQVRLCQKWLRYRHNLSSEACSNSICLFHLCHVLVRCCRSLRSLSLSQPLAPQLRLLEVFTEPSNYPPPHRHTVSTHLCTHLVSNGKTTAYS